MPKMCTEPGSTDQNIRGKIPGKFISYVQDYCETYSMDQQKRVRELHHESEKKSERQTNFNENYFGMDFSKNRNGIASTIV